MLVWCQINIPVPVLPWWGGGEMRPTGQPLWETAVALSREECLSGLTEAALLSWERVCWETGASWSPGGHPSKAWRAVSEDAPLLCADHQSQLGAVGGDRVVDMCTSAVHCLFLFLCGQMLGEINSKQLRPHTKFHTVI